MDLFKSIMLLLTVNSAFPSLQIKLGCRNNIDKQRPVM